MNFVALEGRVDSHSGDAHGLSDFSARVRDVSNVEQIETAQPHLGRLQIHGSATGARIW